jgi:hypothetical protein
VLPDAVTLPVHNVHITTLEVNDTFNYNSLLPVLTQVCDALLSLSFHPSKSGESDLHTALCFPHFKSLVCVVLELESAEALAVISSAWSLPSLESLAFGTHNWVWTTSDKLINTGTIHSFCLTHGKRLRFLLVGPGCIFSTPRMHWEIVDVCLSLEHLVMRLDVSLVSIAHRNIKWIDLWPYEYPYWFTGDYPWETTVLRQASNVKDALPALRGIRTLMPGLPLMSDVPMRICTSSAADKDSFSIQYPGIDIRCERGFLYSFSMRGKKGRYAAGHDESDDEEYVAEESDETDSSSFISDTASVSSGNSDVDMHLPEFSDSDGGALVDSEASSDFMML